MPLRPGGSVPAEIDGFREFGALLWWWGHGRSPVCLGEEDGEGRGGKHVGGLMSTGSGSEGTRQRGYATTPMVVRRFRTCSTDAPHPGDDRYTMNGGVKAGMRRHALPRGPVHGKDPCMSHSCT